jgi:hypothetical protein
LYKAGVLRDFEFIHSTRWNTYFVKDVAASRIDNGPGSKLQAALIADFDLYLTTPQHTLFSDTDLLGYFDHALMQHSTDIGKTRGSQRELNEAAQKRVDSVRTAWRKFIFAILGGLAIVAPVLVIVASSAPLKTLVVVSLSIPLFAVGVATVSTSEPTNLLGATAAYAAVLTVFVGNSTST